MTEEQLRELALEMLQASDNVGVMLSLSRMLLDSAYQEMSDLYLMVKDLQPPPKSGEDKVLSFPNAQ